jgi:uncharacterized protein
MTEKEWELVHRFKTLVAERLHVHQMIVFGSRARGDADEESDLDVLVVVDGPVDDSVQKSVSHCAWEVGFDSGIVISSLAVSRDEWENGPQRYSLLALAIEREGIPA